MLEKYHKLMDYIRTLIENGEDATTIVTFLKVFTTVANIRIINDISLYINLQIKKKNIMFFNI